MSTRCFWEKDSRLQFDLIINISFEQKWLAQNDHEENPDSQVLVAAGTFENAASILAYHMVVQWLPMDMS